MTFILQNALTQDAVVTCAAFAALCVIARRIFAFAKTSATGTCGSCPSCATPAARATSSAMSPETTVSLDAVRASARRPRTV